MNANQPCFSTTAPSLRSLWIATVLVLPMLLPVNAQSPSAKPIPAESTQPSTAPSESRNVYRAGGNVRLAVPVKGDFYAAGGRITVEQPVAGDATLAGGSVTVRAAIGDDLRALGGDITIDSTVGGELYASGGNITLGNAAAVADAVTLYGGNINVEGKISGPLKVYAQRVILNGEVSKDVELNAEEIELGPRAKLGAALRYPINAQFKTAEGVVIGGAVTRGEAMNGRRDTHHDREWHGQAMGGSAGWTGTLAGTAASFVVLLAAAALFLLVFTGFSRRASSQVMPTPWPALAAGLAVLLGTPMLAMLLIVTLIGIPLGIVLMMLFPLMLLMGWIVGVFAITQRVQRAIQKETPSGSSAAMIGFFALTLLLVLLIGSLPFIGFLILLTVLLLGTGACALELYRQFRPKHSPPDSGATGSGTLPRTPLAGMP